MSETEYALGTHCGITFAGIKAASLINLKSECRSCVEIYERHFSRRGFGFLTLREDGARILLFIYNRVQLEKLLFDKDNKRFLEEAGYTYETADEALAILKQRMADGKFPHEIGVFLNYSLEDVKAFIAHPNDGVKLVGYWKVYCDEERKKRIFDQYARCTRRIEERLLSGVPLESIFCKSISGYTALT